MVMETIERPLHCSATGSLDKIERGSAADLLSVDYSTLYSGDCFLAASVLHAGTLTAKSTANIRVNGGQLCRKDRDRPFLVLNKGRNGCRRRIYTLLAQ